MNSRNSVPSSASCVVANEASQVPVVGYCNSQQASSNARWVNAVRSTTTDPLRMPVSLSGFGHVEQVGVLVNDDIEMLPHLTPHMTHHLPNHHHHHHLAVNRCGEGVVFDSHQSPATPNISNNSGNQQQQQQHPSSGKTGDHNSSTNIAVSNPSVSTSSQHFLTEDNTNTLFQHADQLYNIYNHQNQCSPLLYYAPLISYMPSDSCIPPPDHVVNDNQQSALSGHTINNSRNIQQNNSKFRRPSESAIITTCATDYGADQRHHVPDYKQFEATTSLREVGTDNSHLGDRVTQHLVHLNGYLTSELSLGTIDGQQRHAFNNNKNHSSLPPQESSNIQAMNPEEAAIDKKNELNTHRIQARVPAWNSSRKQSTSRKHETGLKGANPRKKPAPTLATGRKSKDDNLPPEEDEKRRMRRERNKIAASKCRRRRADLTKTLEKQTEELIRRKQTLQSQIRRLTEDRKELQQLILSHQSTCQQFFDELSAMQQQQQQQSGNN